MGRVTANPDTGALAHLTSVRLSRVRTHACRGNKKILFLGGHVVEHVADSWFTQKNCLLLYIDRLGIYLNLTIKPGG